MEALLNIVVGVLRLIPLILAFYIPALFGVATLKERGPGYRVKAGLWFALGFGIILAVQLALRSVSAVQIAATLGMAMVQILAALALAALTVYRLAD